MGTTWSTATAAYLVATNACPRCDELLDGSGTCRHCRADLAGEPARAVYLASVAAADAIRARQQLIDELPIAVAVVRGAASTATGVAAVRAVPAAPAAPAHSQSRVSVQSVLAVVGAGLFAIAAFVFTYLNPDLTDFGTRSAVVGVITAVFLGSAWALARAGLRFSAESVGALGVVFLGLDVSAVATALTGAATAGVALCVASTLLVAIGTAVRLRTWLWAGIVGLVATPVALPLVDTLGFLVAGGVALAAHELARRVAPRYASTLRVEHATTTVLLVLASLAVFGSLTPIVEPFLAAAMLPSAAAVAVLAVFAALAARNGQRTAWSAASGVLATTAAAGTAFALPLEGGPWLLAVVPAAVGVALLGVTAAAALPLARWVDRRALLLGAWGALLVAGFPALYAGAMHFITSPFDAIPAEWGAAAITGIATTAAASLGCSALLARYPADAAAPHLRHATLTAALWFGASTLLALASWSAWLPATRLTLALLLTAGLTILALRAPLAAGWTAMQRAPLWLAAHLLVLLAIAIAAVDASLAVVGGVVIVPAIVLLARFLPAAGRAVHIGAAYAYALFVFARALDATELETIAVLCLTTALASVVAFLATTARRLHVRYWYAILVVTAIPFLLGVASVLLERSGWTALSTALIFLLALALVGTERQGLTRALRAAAGAILVPSLAVVVICLGAALLQSSGSPVALPVIAAIVAATLPLTGLGQDFLVRRGIAAAEARVVRIAVEGSTLLSAAIAVLLSLVRSAAGLETTFLVLAIIGVGGLSAGLFTRRRLFWVVAAAGFTGALWSALAIAGVSGLEPYILPPALAATLIGVLGVARGAAGQPLFVAGLGASIIPSLVVLTVGDDGFGALRTGALLAAALLLLGLAGLFGRMVRLAGLRIPTLFAAIVASSAGAVQGVLWGLGAAFDNVAERSWSILALGVAATLLAGFAAAGIARLSPSLAASRTLYVPAAVFLVAGSMAGIRAEVLPVAILIGLMLLLLGGMLLAVWRGRDGGTALPPVWVLFGLAWLTAVAAWSPRELLRVEAFSLPLGAFLLAAGAIVLARPGTTGNRSWPVRFAGSWRLLTPGILVTLVPSVLATATDPRTERAILVIGLALVAILLGSLLRLAAPFVLGILVLPIENVIVFAVQLGRQIESAPWWMTLATAGATLLVIAITSERRGGGVAGVGAQLRDLA